ncbi:unannotated protein [freshwater metagenome]|uniref:Unannotated protein n=1 Tax=freshwater metagenome TaxID=449393 RepID=A0A6J6EX45_9ZZZZ
MRTSTVSGAVTPEFPGAEVSPAISSVAPDEQATTVDAPIAIVTVRAMVRTPVREDR